MRFTHDEVAEWLKKKTVNPRTGRKISPDGPIYEQLQFQSKSRFFATTALRRKFKAAAAAKKK